MIFFQFGPGFQQGPPPQDHNAAFNSYLCEVRKGDTAREIHLPTWQCQEGSEVSLGPDRGWKLLKIIHQIYG
jgi:hypothetical protein